MNKKFQVFISSTYTDLVAERKAVEETIIRAGDIPVGMEAFPAADDEQFEFIKTVIDSCDYYVLIVAGRYGSLSEDGISYTEKEFHYAVERGIPVLFFLHAAPETLAVNKTETGEIGRAKLAKFIDLAGTKRIRKAWNNSDALKLAVREALDFAKATKPRPGWVRGGEVTDTELLLEINQIRKENEALKREVTIQNRFVLPFELSDLDLEFTLNGKGSIRENGYTSGKTISWTQKTSLKEIFRAIAPNMRGDLIHSTLNNIMAISAQNELESKLSYPNRYTVDTFDFNSVLVQLEAFGLVETARIKLDNGNNASFSKLTQAGERVMYEISVRKQA